jgi:hypothetical protein
MSRKRPQKVTIRISWPDNPKEWPAVERVVENTNSGNLRSKITTTIDLMLIQHNVSEGATITVTIDPEEPDEFANPER